MIQDQSVSRDFVTASRSIPQGFQLVGVRYNHSDHHITSPFHLLGCVVSIQDIHCEKIKKRITKRILTELIILSFYSESFKPTTLQLVVAYILIQVLLLYCFSKVNLPRVLNYESELSERGTTFRRVSVPPLPNGVSVWTKASLTY